MKEIEIDRSIAERFSRRPEEQRVVFIYTQEAAIMAQTQRELTAFIRSGANLGRDYLGNEFDKQIYLKAAYAAHYLLRSSLPKVQVTRKEIVKTSELTMGTMQECSGKYPPELVVPQWLLALGTKVNRAAPDLTSVIFPQAIPTEGLWGIADIAIPYFYALNPREKL